MSRRARRSHWSFALAFLALAGAAHLGCKPRLARSTPAPRAKDTGSAGIKAKWGALSLPRPLATLLERGSWDATPETFRILALSFLADSCLGQAQRDPTLKPAARACVERVAVLARATKPSDFDVHQIRHGLWASHMALIWGAADALGPCLDAHGHEGSARGLARASLADPTLHVPSYPSRAFRWPADQSATLAALHRFDRGHRQTVAEEPTARWLALLEHEGLDRSSGLPRSEMTGKAKGAHEPRGCALSFQLRYLHEFAPRVAEGWWKLYRERFLTDLFVLVGFREWPPGRERAADIDSGPIVQGVGTAASALGIAAARALGDEQLAVRLESSVDTAKGLAGARAAKAAETQLASAILLLGRYVPQFAAP